MAIDSNSGNQAYNTLQDADGFIRWYVELRDNAGNTTTISDRGGRDALLPRVEENQTKASIQIVYWLSFDFYINTRLSLGQNQTCTNHILWSLGIISPMLYWDGRGR